MLQTFDERNRDLLVNVNGVLRHRDEPHVSAFDSVVQGGDAVWEGLRVYDGRVFRLTEHLARLRRSARALAFAEVPDDAAITDADRARRCAANGMRDGVHVRLTLTRGVKITSGMDPRLNQSGPTLIVLAEHKPPVYDTAGITLVTASVRRPGPDVLDPKIHHNNLHQLDPGQDRGQRRRRRRRAAARRARLRRRDQRHARLPRRRRGGPDADHPGLPGGDHPGGRPGAAAPRPGVPHEVDDISPAELRRADEVFVTGTMGELVPVLAVDGVPVGGRAPRAGDRGLTAAFRALTAAEGVRLVD